MYQARPASRRRQARRIGRRTSRRLRLRPTLAALAILTLAAFAPSVVLAPRPEAPAGSPAATAPGVGAAPPNDGVLSATPPPADPRFQAALDAAQAVSGSWGLELAVVKDGRLVYSGASGTADGAILLSPDAPLVVGSVTKTYVAALILQLVDEGRLSLDTPVAELLPDVPGIAGMRVRELLDHSSGIADLFNEATRVGIEESPDRPWTAAELLGTLDEPSYAPGEGWSYANTNYYLLGLVGERIAGRPLADELRERFFAPLELSATRLLDPVADAGGPLGPAWTTIFWASGTAVSNAPDLARWGDALFRGELHTPETREEMLAFNGHDYGLGVQLLDVGPHRGWGHTGLIDSYTTLLFHLPERGVTIALLANRAHADVGGLILYESGGVPSILELALAVE